MSPITALVAEDEPLLQAELADALHALWPELSIVGRASDGIEALRLFLALRPSVLFLDIEMPGLSGLEVAKQATAHAHIVFVTAYDQYALAAFDQGAVDYVVKPLSIPRMSTTVQRLKARVTEPPPDHTAPSRNSNCGPSTPAATCAGSMPRSAGPSISSPSRRSAISRPTPSTRWS